LQRCFEFFFSEELFYGLPFGLIERGLQQILEPLDVDVCDVGEVNHRQPSNEEFAKAVVRRVQEAFIVYIRAPGVV
jgi:hypothetical protein